MAGTLDLATYRFKVEVDTRGLERGLRNADSSVANSTRQSSKAGKMISAGMKVLAAKMVKDTIKIGAEYESTMSKVQAISGATGDDMSKLSDKAREIGKSTKFSASEVGEGFTYMAQAGWKTEDMLQGIDGVMNLAAASGEDLAVVSSIVTDSLSAFGMEAKESSKFADLLASASSNSNTNVTELGEAFKHVAPLAGALGYSAEDTALALGLMANAGIKGSKAGTALKNVISGLTNPTDKQAQAMTELGISIKNADGTMKPFNQVLVEMREKFKSMTPEQKAQYAATIAGKQGMAGFLAVMNAGEEDFEKMTKATTEYTGVAKKMSEVMEDNLQGDITKLKSALQELAISGFQAMLPILRDVVSKLQSLVDWFSNLDESTQKTIVKMAALSMTVKPVVNSLNNFGLAIGALTGEGGLIALTKGITAGGAAMGKFAGLTQLGAVLLNPYTLAIVAAAAATAVFVAGMKRESIPAMEKWSHKVSESTQNAIDSYLELENETTAALRRMFFSQGVITDENQKEIEEKLGEQTAFIIEHEEKRYEKRTQQLENFFKNNEGLTEEDKEALTKIEEDKHKKNIDTTKQGQKRINEILENAKKENRATTKEEQSEINAIQRKMQENAVTAVSKSREEQELIYNTLKNNSTRISAQQASQIVKDSVKQRDKTIKEAEREYQDRLKYAEELRADGTAESAALADKVEKEAKRQRDGAVKEAKSMHNNVVKEAKAQAGEHASSIDWETGEVLSTWGRMKKGVSEKVTGMMNKLKEWNKLPAETKQIKAQNKASSIIDSALGKLKEWNKTTPKTKTLITKSRGGNNAAQYGFAVGTPFVSRDQSALIHEGEAIIPKRYNPFTKGGHFKPDFANALGGGGSNYNIDINIDNVDSGIDIERAVENGIERAEAKRNSRLKRKGI